MSQTSYNEMIKNKIRKLNKSYNELERGLNEMIDNTVYVTSIELVDKRDMTTEDMNNIFLEIGDSYYVKKEVALDVDIEKLKNDLERITQEKNELMNNLEQINHVKDKLKELPLQSKWRKVTRILRYNN